MATAEADAKAEAKATTAEPPSPSHSQQLCERDAVDEPNQEPRWKRRGRAFLRSAGPGFLIAVGYMDPGNWATDLEAGSKYNYELLYVILLSTAMAVVLQHLCVRVGLVTGADLAELCRREFGRGTAALLYVLAEFAMIATDVAEVIGTALALKLLFDIPLLYGVLLTALDVLLLLGTWGVRTIKLFEGATVALLLAVGACFVALLAQIPPDWAGVARGCVPTWRSVSEGNRVYLAVSILGATIMPHNLYLHSHVVRYHRGDDAAPSAGQIRSAIVYSTLDTVVALALAVVVNAAILVLGASAFYGRDPRDGRDAADLVDAHALLSENLGKVWGGGLFAVALLLAGNSSTLASTLTGQIVTEGFCRIRIPRAWRHLVTRLLAVVPAVAVAAAAGERGMSELLVGSQVALSIQLPFAAWPLVYFAASPRIMRLRAAAGGDSEAALLDGGELGDSGGDSAGSLESFETRRGLTLVCCLVASVITLLNVVLLASALFGSD